MKKIYILLSTILVWFICFVVHGFIHLKSVLPEACCGYEADPGFIVMMFVIYYGFFYIIALVLILPVEMLILSEIKDKKQS